MTGTRSSAVIGTRSFAAIGTTVSVLTTDPRAAGAAEDSLRRRLDELDRACSRFRPDSELSRLHDAGGGVAAVTPLLAELVAAALEVAELTGGLVDPTVGNAVIALGYDSDLQAVAPIGPALAHTAGPVSGWRRVELDRSRGMLRLPPGTRLDLGCSAKAFAADRAAVALAGALGCGVLVNLGGDIAVAGEPPADGWNVGLALAASTAPEQTTTVVSIRHGGLASSGTVVRTWTRGDRRLHHIVDPRSGECADGPWSLVSVAAETCLLANAASTASLVLGEAAPDWLERHRLPARLVRHDGSVTVVGGWPADR